MYQLFQEYVNEDTDVTEHREAVHTFQTLPTDSELAEQLAQFGCPDDKEARQSILDGDYVLLDRHENLYGLERVQP